jgi:DNA sulfur modification protein DndD
MLVTRLVLKNYGVYRDQHEFNFKTEPNKPIILIGGTNGAGKTTLFESILLCLYGQTFFNRKSTRKSYEKFLSNKIHRYIGTPVSADHASIIVDFKFYHNAKEQDYSVDRTWRNEDGKMIESLTITRDGEVLDFTDELQWQSFIEELIPHGIAQLFFFDGEKIVKIAEENNEDIQIKSSFDSLLGLDLIEQLHSDLKVHILRNMKDDYKTIQQEHDRKSKEKNETEDEIKFFQDKLVQKETQINQISKEIDELENKVSKIGGGYATKRGELHIQKALFEAKKTASENNLRAILALSTPFGLIPKLIHEVKEQLVEDEKILKRQFEDEISLEKFKNLEAHLKTDADWKKIDAKTRTSIITKISQLFENKMPTKKTGLFNLSQVDSTNLLNIIEKDIPSCLENLKLETEIYREIHEKLEKVDVALTSAPKDDEIGPMISKLSSLNEDRGTLIAEKNHLEQQLSSKQSYLKLVKFSLRNINTAKYRNKGAGIQVELAAKVQKILDEYAIKLKEKKLKLLEEYLLDAIHQLMHKEDFIQHVSIDKETFNMTLYRKNKDPFPTDLLSKGEQQMLATAILWALARTSGKPLPFMIDTPLARLDLEHRENLIEKFYPFASHQVVIFSTDSEIEGPEYLKLLPHISRSYAMRYQPGKGKTEVTEGYFWNEKGEKVATI